MTTAFLIFGGSLFAVHLALAVYLRESAWIDASGGWLTICGIVLAVRAASLRRRMEEADRRISILSDFFFRGINESSLSDLRRQRDEFDSKSFIFGIVLGIIGTCVSAYGPIIMEATLVDRPLPTLQSDIRLCIRVSQKRSFCAAE